MVLLLFSADDGFSAFAVLYLAFFVVVPALTNAGLGSIGSLAAVLSKHANPFASRHPSMLACGGERQLLQPATVAATAPMRSVLMHSSRYAEFRSQCSLRDGYLRWPFISCAKKLSAD
jgi:hypothetical protein